MQGGAWRGHRADLAQQPPVVELAKGGRVRQQQSTMTRLPRRPSPAGPTAVSPGPGTDTQGCCLLPQLGAIPKNSSLWTSPPEPRGTGGCAEVVAAPAGREPTT